MLRSVAHVAVRSRERTRLSFKARHDLGVGVVDLVVPTGLMSQAQVLHSLELLAERFFRASAISGWHDGPF